VLDHPPKANIFEPSRRSPALVSGDVASQSATPPSEYSRGGTPPGHLWYNSAALTAVAPAQEIDLRPVWQSALLDSFLTIWIPRGLVRECASGETTSSAVPMSAWPSVAWRIAKRESEGIVAHSVLCLTLCILGSRTNDTVLVAEASRHYSHVLQHFQTQVSQLGRSAHAPDRDRHIASLVAAGFCCSQVEYILNSWTSGDQHLQGMESLLQAFGPSCLANSDTRRIFFDHCLLWLSCSVVHRRPGIYSHWPFSNDDWTEIAAECRSAQQLVGTTARLPPLLQELDAMDRSHSAGDMLALFQRITSVIVDLLALDVQNKGAESPRAFETLSKLMATTDTLLDPSVLSEVVITGYSSAFLIHAAVAALRSAALMRDRGGWLPASELRLSELRDLCETQVAQLRALMSELADEKYGMITASPMLFFMDSAWIAYEALEEFNGRDLSDVRPWFCNFGDLVASTGYRPLRTSWLVA